MYLKRLLKIHKTIGFRLTVWYSSIFVLSSLLLFATLYFFLSSTISRQDHETILSELKVLSAEYQRAGMTSLENEETLNRKFRKKHPFFIRIAGARNNTLHLSFPYQWTEFDLNKLEKIVPDNTMKWIRLPSIYGDYVLEVATVRLPDGFWLQVGMSTEGRERVLARFRETFAFVVIPLFLIGLISGSFLSFRALRPIRQLIRTVQSIDMGEMEARVPPTETGDELDELVRLFNGMLEKIKTLINAMRGSLDNVAHDLRTPMTRLRNIAETALQSKGGGDLCREALADAVEESDRVLVMLNTLMDISEAETGVMNLDLKVVDISALIAGVFEIYSTVAEQENLSIHISVPEGLRMTADQNRISQVLGNLLDNAIKYTPSGGQIFLAASRSRGEIIISIKDTGVGISQENLPRIWERLYRGDQSRSQRGLGLGLSLVKAIVLAHKGRVEVFSEPGKGSVFNIHIPSGDPSSL
jgi:signal transduction histidine kinase